MADQVEEPPFFVLEVGMPIVGKAVHPILVAQIAFAELAVMVKGDLLSDLKKRVGGWEPCASSSTDGGLTLRSGISEAATDVLVESLN